MHLTKRRNNRPRVLASVQRIGDNDEQISKDIALEMEGYIKTHLYRKIELEIISTGDSIIQTFDRPAKFSQRVWIYRFILHPFPDGLIHIDFRPQPKERSTNVVRK